MADLGEKQASFTPVADRYYGAGCSTIQTVKLLSVRGDYSALGITNLGPVTCVLADRFAAWARFGVDRAARQILGSQLIASRPWAATIAATSQAPTTAPATPPAAPSMSAALSWPMAVESPCWATGQPGRRRSASFCA
jgi:hypothetical protein